MNNDILSLNFKFISRIHENGGAEEFVVQFAVEIWSQAGNSMDSNAPFEEKD
ncbi:hypothetical protein TSUD_148410 [Trifolium subterraneum]|uniref:Uncharacterized protein n=1 Tax=Trifolium subterraneum TaxID=3900 RepID=A0A2Z6MQP2_TRISU|nr:hypothetical protein TSUD_148410 [Trifolium subterraneum]